MSQQSMFPVALEAMNVMVYRSETGGWHLRVGVRLEGARWTGAEWIEYDGLSWAEVLDVIDASNP